MAVKAIGVAQAAKACGFTKSHVSRVATGQRKSSNTLIKRAIKKYVTIVEVPEIDAEKELENLARRLK